VSSSSINETLATGKTAIIDAETYSSVILRDTTVPIYAAHPATGIWCVCYVLGDGSVKTWRPGEPLPEELFAAPTFVAHNAPFEINLWRYKLTPVYGWPEVPPLDHWVCTMASAQRVSLPPSLAKGANALQLTHRKGDDSLMRRMARPRLPRKDEDPAVLHWNDDPEDFKQLCAYCAGDVLCERELHQQLLRHWDQQGNISGNLSNIKTNAA
jgi:DNA polymerase